MFSTYILQSKKTNKLYIGYTSNLERRIQAHNLGLTRSSRNQGSYELIYQEVFVDKTDAIKRERQLKSYKGGEALKKLISPRK